MSGVDTGWETDDSTTSDKRSEPGADGSASPPLGIKVLVLLGGVFTLVGFLWSAVLLLSQPVIGLLLLALTVLWLMAYVGLYTLSGWAYLLFMGLSGLSIVGAFVFMELGSFFGFVVLVITASLAWYVHRHRHLYRREVTAEGRKNVTN